MTSQVSLTKSPRRTSRTKSGPKTSSPRRPRRTRRPVKPGLLAGLGVVGMEKIEPVVLAALISSDPLLLIGLHGTGKSYLLNRVSQALKLEWRHYNASLLNYDDLVGYPLPDADGQLRYVQTPASIWGAQIVFVDEISRCRPDMQNKLFPIIHERRVQGILLDRLIYRWSAMNPPAGDFDVATDDVAGYIGSEPLDPALADRFAFVVEMPAWGHYNKKQQEAIILCADDPVDPEAAAALRAFLKVARPVFHDVRRNFAIPLATYVRHLSALLAKADVDLSPRRTTCLLRNILSVHAARVTIDSSSDLMGSTFLALTHSLPQRAGGMAINPVSVLGAHKEAWRLASMDSAGVSEAIMLEKNPLKRVMLAMKAELMPQGEFSTIVADAIADMPEGARYATATALFESGPAGRLVAAVAEQCAKLYAYVADQMDAERTLGREDHLVAQKIKEHLTGCDKVESRRRSNLLNNLFGEERLLSRSDMRTLVREWTNAWKTIKEQS